MSAAASEERIVRLLDEDADLAERISPERRRSARTELRARAVTFPPGVRVEEAPALRNRTAHGLVLLDGLVGRSMRLGESMTMQLLGPGDLMEIPDSVPDSRLVPVAISWTVLEQTTVALLDERLMQRALRWPELLSALLERASIQSLRLGTYGAISALARVEDRIETLLWFLAERWGRVGSHGVVLPLRLTHETLGTMLGAKRPTVSLALKQLAADGLVERRDDGAWLLLRPFGELPFADDRRGGGVQLLARRDGEAAIGADAVSPPATPHRPRQPLWPPAAAAARR